jgi:hypothetical protein
MPLAVNLPGTEAGEARRRLPRNEDGSVTPGWVTGAAAMDVLACFGVPVLRGTEVYSAEEAGRLAEQIGGPVALKVLGRVQKKKGRGVKLDLVGAPAVKATYQAMQAGFGGAMTGALVQPMAPGAGVETMVGGMQDPTFGPLVVFGPGGGAVAVRGDHVTRLAPVTDVEAMEMVTGLRGPGLFNGSGGSPAVDLDAVTRVLHGVSRLVEALPEVAEIDCNPVLATAEGALVLDARLRLDVGPVPH